MADDDESTSSSENEPAPAGEESEPAPAGEGEEPAPAGESSSSDSDTNLEPPEATSDSSAETDGSDSDSSGSGRKRKSSSDDSDSSSSDSSDSSSQPAPLPSEDEVASALASALQMRDVKVDDDGVKVTLEDGLFHLMVRVSAQGTPLPQVPDDTSNLAPGSVTGAMYLLQGSVQIFGDQTKVSLRLVSVATSEILETGQAMASGDVLAGIQGAAEDALASLPTLCAT